MDLEFRARTFRRVMVSPTGRVGIDLRALAGVSVVLLNARRGTERGLRDGRHDGNQSTLARRPACGLSTPHTGHNIA
jgi:hypothetical protein